MFDSQLLQALPERAATAVLAEHQLVRLPPDILGTHDLVGLAALEHAVLVYPRLVSESIGADDRLVGLYGKSGDSRHQLGSRHDLRGVDMRITGKHVLPCTHAHDGLL